MLNRLLGKSAKKEQKSMAEIQQSVSSLSFFRCNTSLEQMSERETYLEGEIDKKTARINELKQRIMSTNSPSIKNTAKREALSLIKQRKAFHYFNISPFVFSQFY